MTDVTAEKPGQRPRVLTNIIGVRLEPALYDRVEAAASADRRSLSGWVRKLIVEQLEKKA